MLTMMTVTYSHDDIKKIVDVNSGLSNERHAFFTTIDSKSSRF